MLTDLRGSSSVGDLDHVVLAVGIGLITVNAVCAAPLAFANICKWRRKLRSTGIWQAARATCQRCLFAACVCLRAEAQLGKDKNDLEQDAYITKQMNLLRLAGMKVCISRGLWLLCVINATGVYKTWWKMPRANTICQDCVFFAAHLLFIMLLVRPHLLNVRTTSVWYSFVMLLVALVLPLADEDRIGHYCVMVMTAQIIFSSAHLDFKFYAFWNTFVCFMFVLSRVRSVDSFTRDTLVAFIFFTAILISSLRTTELHMEQQVRYRVDATAARNEHSAARAVLNTVCDVVVDLDDDLQLMEHSPRFAAMFFLSPSRNLRGTKLQAFMPDNYDHEVFEEHMKRRGPDDERGMANTFHLRMRDADRNALSVELFSFQFDALDQKVRYLVGIREWTDVAPLAALPDASLIANTLRNSNLLTLQKKSISSFDAADAEVSSVASSDSGASSVAQRTVPLTPYSSFRFPIVL